MLLNYCFIGQCVLKLQIFLGPSCTVCNNLLETMKSCDDAVVCVLGDFCVLKTGDIGVCQPLTQCTTAVYQALHGDMPIVCSIKENMPIVCCARSPTVRLQPETQQNIIQKQNPTHFTSQYYLFDAGIHEISSTDFPVRHSRRDRDEPWWLIEKPFAQTPPAPLQKPQYSNNNNGNTNHNQGTSRPENLQNQWLYSERPFSSELPPPPPPSPPPKPVTEPVNSQNRYGQARVSAISKLNPNIQNSCSRFVFVLTVVWIRLGIHSSGI